MSYNLFLYKKKDHPLTECEIKNQLRQIVPNTPLDESEAHGDISDLVQINYVDQKAEGSFLLELNEPWTEEEDLLFFNQFEEYEHINTSISIRLKRSMEANEGVFSVIEDFCKQLDLYILNPNLSKGEEKLLCPLRWENGTLYAHYNRINDSALRYLAIDLATKDMENEQASYFKNYVLNHISLKEEVVEDIYIPELLILRCKATRNIYTAVVWTDNIPIVLPKVDLVVLIKNYKKFFFNINKRGIATYQSIIEKFGSQFEVYDKDRQLLILKQTNAHLLTKEFNVHPIDENHREKFVQVSYNEF